MSGPGVPPPTYCLSGGTPPPGSFTLHGRPVDVFADLDGGRHALLYVRARHYDLAKGRWLQRDPKGYVDGPNLYEAFGGNPLVFVDPFGLEGEEALSKWDRRLRWRPGMVPRNEEQWKFYYDEMTRNRNQVYIARNYSAAAQRDPLEKPSFHTEGMCEAFDWAGGVGGTVAPGAGDTIDLAHGTLHVLEEDPSGSFWGQSAFGRLSVRPGQK